MLYYYAEKSRLCLLRHSIIIVHSFRFVNRLRKSLVILPRYANAYRGFFGIQIRERLFQSYLRKKHTGTGKKILPEDCLVLRQI